MTRTDELCHFQYSTHRIILYISVCVCVCVCIERDRGLSIRPLDRNNRINNGHLRRAQASPFSPLLGLIVLWPLRSKATCLVMCVEELVGPLVKLQLVGQLYIFNIFKRRGQNRKRPPPPLLLRRIFKNNIFSIETVRSIKTGKKGKLKLGRYGILVTHISTSNPVTHANGSL